MTVHLFNSARRPICFSTWIFLMIPTSSLMGIDLLRTRNQRQVLVRNRHSLLYHPLASSNGLSGGAIALELRPNICNFSFERDFSQRVLKIPKLHLHSKFWIISKLTL